MTIINPAIGRKVWFRPAWLAAGFMQHSKDQPLDATVVYVWNERCVNLRITDHEGKQFSLTSVALRQPDDPVPGGSYAEWMPYQQGQAKKDAGSAT